MGYFNKSDLLAKHSNLTTREAGIAESVLARVVLARAAKGFTSGETYDIFLSHSSEDALLIAALRDALVAMGYRVYVDWVEDAKLSRDNVSAQNANVLRERMRTCLSLFYATTESAKESVWMPWELGYMDAHTGRAAILPVGETPEDMCLFKDQQYLGLYPHVDITGGALYIHKTASKWVAFDDWLNGQEPT